MVYNFHDFSEIAHQNVATCRFGIDIAMFCNSKDFQFSSQELKKKYGGDSGIENTTSSSKIQLNSRAVGGGFGCCGS